MVRLPAGTVNEGGAGRVRERYLAPSGSPFHQGIMPSRR